MRLLIPFTLACVIAPAAFTAQFLKPLDMSGNAITNASALHATTGAFSEVAAEVVVSSSGLFSVVDAWTGLMYHIEGDNINMTSLVGKTGDFTYVLSQTGDISYVHSRNSVAENSMQAPTGLFSNIEAKFYSGLMGDTQNVLFVSNNGYPDGDGSVTRPYDSLYTALATPVHNKSILLMPGDYHFGSAIVLDSTYSNLTISGFSDLTEAIVLISTNDDAQILTIDGAEAITVRSLTFISTNFSQTGAGAIYIQRNTIENCRFLSCANNNGNGGGVVAVGGTLIKACEFNDCHSSGHGGGVYASDAVILEDCRFSDCSAYYNGGALSMVTNCEVTDCAIERCYSRSPVGDGGGAYLSVASTIRNSNIEDCYSGYGGGIFATEGCSIDNCEIKRCMAVSYGGGAYAHTGDSIYYTRLVDCVTSNEVGAGGAVSLSSNSKMEYCSVPRGAGYTNQLEVTAGSFIMATVTNYDTNGFVVFSTTGN